QLRRVQGEQLRLEAAVEIETVDVVAGASAQRNDVSEIARQILENLEAFRPTVAGRVQRCRGFDPKGESARAALALQPIRADLLSKRRDGKHHEYGRRDQADDGEAARAACPQVEPAEVARIDCRIAIVRSKPHHPPAAKGDSSGEQGEACE